MKIKIMDAELVKVLKAPLSHVIKLALYSLQTSIDSTYNFVSYINYTNMLFQVIQFWQSSVTYPTWMGCL
jgi:hypothetical protein